MPTRKIPDRSIIGIGIGAGALALALLATPSVLRALRRRSWRGAAARGDALAAWSAVRETALDLGIPVPAAESPRRFAARIVERHGSDPPATGMLLRAVERASFAGDAIDPSHGPQLVRALDDIEHSMRAATPGIPRVMARMFPRSLVGQPGDAGKDTGIPDSIHPDLDRPIVCGQHELTDRSHRRPLHSSNSSSGRHPERTSLRVTPERMY